MEASHFVAVKSTLKTSNWARLKFDFGLDFNADDLDFVVPKKPKVQIWQPVSVHEPDLKRKEDLISEILPTDPPGFSKPWLEPQEALRKEVSNITVFDLADLTANQGRTIKFLQNMKLLHTRRACDSCDNADMGLFSRRDNDWFFQNMLLK